MSDSLRINMVVNDPDLISYLEEHPPKKRAALARKFMLFGFASSGSTVIPFPVAQSPATTLDSIEQKDDLIVKAGVGGLF